MIADGKRGDIATSATAYGQALLGGTETPFGRVPGLGADAATVNPLLGEDALEPLIDIARGRGRRGVFVLVRTSNPGAADLFDARARRRRPAVGADRARWSTWPAPPGRGRGSPTSAPSPARPPPGTSRGCAS